MPIALGRYLFYSGKNLPLFIVGKYSLFGDSKISIYPASGSCYVRAIFDFLSVPSLFDVGSSAKSKSKSRSISSSDISKSMSAISLSGSGKSKDKSRSRTGIFTASFPLHSCSPPVPLSTVPRQFLGVRSWFNCFLRLLKHSSVPVQNGSGQVRQTRASDIVSPSRFSFLPTAIIRNFPRQSRSIPPTL